MSASALVGDASTRLVLVGGIIDTDFVLLDPVRTRVFYCSDRINQTECSRVNPIHSQVMGDVRPAYCGKAVMPFDNYKLGE